MKRGPYRKRPIYHRFAEKVLVDASGCLLWTASRNNRGYGTFSLSANTKVYAHRWSYEYHIGLIPQGLQLDHLCRVRHCVNPTHLEPVTNRENALRAPHSQTPTCSNGHLRTAENTYRRRDTGTRQCRRCTSERTSRIGRETRRARREGRRDA